MDDHSKCTWVFLIKHKSNTQFLIQSFFNMVVTQFQLAIKVVRSDNGTKFALDLSMFPKELFINYLVWKPHNKFNSWKKRQHLLSVARALRFQANLPLKVWGDCILTLTTTYLINEIPSPSLHNLTYFAMFLIEVRYETLTELTSSE